MPEKPDASITLVLAMSENGVIGDRGAIPWHIADDLRRFKALTMGRPLVMGRKTWDSLPRKPLPGRTNIVVTRRPGWREEGAVTASSLEAALAAARAENPDAVMVIGGAQIYAQALPLAGRIELTLVRAMIDGDTRLPAFDPAGWCEVWREEHAPPQGPAYAFVTLERRSVPG
jgi:dihydrofolate reductase